jgi:hypothetical protein
MPAQAADCSTVIYVESMIKSCSETGVAGLSATRISCMHWNGLTKRLDSHLCSLSKATLSTNTWHIRLSHDQHVE